MTTDSYSALNILQKYVYELHDIDDLDIVKEVWESARKKQQSLTYRLVI